MLPTLSIVAVVVRTAKTPNLKPNQPSTKLFINQAKCHNCYNALLAVRFLNTKIMKVFKFYCGETIYAFAAETKELAIAEFEEQTGDQFTNIEEIPESEWNEKIISTWEDNNFDNKPFKVSINEIICGKEPQMIFTNDYSNF